jgi:hypothetical protein
MPFGRGMENGERGTGNGERKKNILRSPFTARSARPGTLGTHATRATGGALLRGAAFVAVCDNLTYTPLNPEFGIRIAMRAIKFAFFLHFDNNILKKFLHLLLRYFTKHGLNEQLTMNIKYF